MPFYVAVTDKLIRPGGAIAPPALDTITAADLTEITQFEDVEIEMAISEPRTGRVTLSMYDPVVADLRALRFATQIGYLRPGETFARGETVIFGQTNVIDDYANGKVHLEVYDPAIRIQRHHLRYWDAILDDPADVDKGTMHIDYRGIWLLIDAAEISDQPAESDGTTEWDREVPILGMGKGVTGDANANNRQIQIERGQETWTLISDITRNIDGPDIDVRPEWELPASYYAYIDCYTDATLKMGRDLTESITLSYGLAGDNCEGVTVTPGLPTNYAHSWDAPRQHRRTAGSRASADRVGIFVGWVENDFELKRKQTFDWTGVTWPGFQILDTEPLYEIARAHVKAYSGPPKFTDLELRPDAAQQHFFGHPDWDLGDTVGDFYLGDRITVAAERGYRSFDDTYRITGVRLVQQGPAGLTRTQLELVPSTVDADEEEEQ